MNSSSSGLYGVWRHCKYILNLSLPSTNKTDCHDITEILLKVTLNTIKQTTNIAKYSAKQNPE